MCGRAISWAPFTFDDDTVRYPKEHTGILYKSKSHLFVCCFILDSDTCGRAISWAPFTFDDDTVCYPKEHTEIFYKSKFHLLVYWIRTRVATLSHECHLLLMMIPCTIQRSTLGFYTNKNPTCLFIVLSGFQACVATLFLSAIYIFSANGEFNKIKSY